MQIQCILQDVGSNIATPRSSAREIHRSMQMQAGVISLFFITDVIFYLFYFFCFTRENKVQSSANHRPGNMDWSFYRGTPAADQLHFTCKHLSTSVDTECSYEWLDYSYLYFTVWGEEQRSFALSSDSLSKSRAQVSFTTHSCDIK